MTVAQENHRLTGSEKAQGREERDPVHTDSSFSVTVVTCLIGRT